jgi:hypothetical protein
MYYIYHIPGVKIGCTTQPDRRVNQQGATEYEILETHSDIHIVSQREIELQKQYGYKVDNTLYSQSYEWATKAGFNARSKGGKSSGTMQRDNGLLKKFQSEGGKVRGPIQGKKNSESGLISKLGKKNSEFNNRIRQCPHCGITTRGVGYERWHGDKCKHKKTPLD